MQLKRTAIGAQTPHLADAAFALAGLGITHFIMSLIAWAAYFVGRHRNGGIEHIVVEQTIFHLLPALMLFCMFVWALIAVLRHRARSARRLLAIGIVASLGIFAVEARGEPQLRRVWIGDPTSCTNQQSYYCTWWWWQPTRHNSPQLTASRRVEWSVLC